MGILDDNYSAAIGEQVKYMVNLFTQAENAVYRVKDKYEAYRNDPHSKYNAPYNSFSYHIYRKYPIIIKYDKDNQHMVHTWSCEVSSYTSWHLKVDDLKEFIKSLIAKGYKVTKVYTK